MKVGELRGAFLTRAALVALVSWVAWSCGSDPEKNSGRPSGPQGGEGGDGPSGSGGGGGAQLGGQAGERGEAENGGAAGKAEPALQAGASGEGGGAFGEGGAVSGGAVSGGAGGAGGEGGSEPVIDVGVGCIAPAKQAPLSAAAAGLPESGLRLWLRGDRGVYATDAQRVCAWADQSGNRHLLLANGVNRALWGGNSLGTQAAIFFDTANSYVSVAGVLDIAATSARTFIAVVQQVNTTGRFVAVMQGQGGTPGTYVNLDTNTFQTAGSREGVYVHNNAYDTTLATSSLPRVHVFTVGAMTPATAVLGAIDYRVNGATQTLTRTPGGLGNGNFENFSGANFTLVGSGTPAIVAEAIIYDRALTIPERASAETALKSRYGIQ